jgi:signal transduction histidine kinase
MPTTHSPPPLSSQQALALQIAQTVQRELPDAGSQTAIAALTASALRGEEQRNELLLAYVRAAFLASYFALSLVAVLYQPALAAAEYPLLNPLVAGVSTGIAIALLAALRRGWYELWLRRAVPVLDALIIAANLWLLYVLQSAVAPPAGFVAVGATACTFLAFSGALRLSRFVTQLTTALALGVWLGLALLAGLRAVETVSVALVLVATGFLAGRVGRTFYRVIGSEVSRSRLAGLYSEAKSAIDAREEVLQVVSHDLRNPLGTIAMATEMLLDTPLSEEQRRHFLKMIQRTGERMGRLVHDLLDVARMEGGRLSVEPRCVEVMALFSDVLELMGPLAREKELGMNLSVQPGTPDVRVDPERILQVFSNLVGNAIKFTPKGGSITLRAQAMGEKVRLSVADTGPGIPPEKLARLFDRFWQADARDRRGIGLGLSIAKHIVEAHGERIGVESRVGQGTEFWFTVAVDVP